MCGSKEQLRDLRSIKPKELYAANGTTLVATQEGTVTLKFQQGEKQVYADVSRVLYVPGLEEILLSVSRLANKGVSVEFNQGGCALRAQGKLLASARLVEGLYRLNAQPEVSMEVADPEEGGAGARKAQGPLGSTPKGATSEGEQPSGGQALTKGSTRNELMVAEGTSPSSKGESVGFLGPNGQIVQVRVMGPSGVLATMGPKGGLRVKGTGLRVKGTGLRVNPRGKSKEETSQRGLNLGPKEGSRGLRGSREGLRVEARHDPCGTL
jgi:hypothetical protein